MGGGGHSKIGATWFMDVPKATIADREGFQVRFVNVFNEIWESHLETLLIIVFE